MREIASEVGGEAHRAIAEALRPAEQRHTARRQAPKVDGPAAIGAADRDRDVLP